MDGDLLGCLSISVGPSGLAIKASSVRLSVRLASTSTLPQARKPCMPCHSCHDFTRFHPRIECPNHIQPPPASHEHPSGLCLQLPAPAETVSLCCMLRADIFHITWCSKRNVGSCVFYCFDTRNAVLLSLVYAIYYIYIII